MGDLIHTLPALTDAGKAIADIHFDWVVEDSFAEIPHWHPLVDNVIPIALRRWRKRLTKKDTRGEWRSLRKELKQQKYDLVLDAQGLVKSAFISMFAKGPRAGLDYQSARESMASFAYKHKYTVNFYQHAVVRMRELFSLALGYDMPKSLPEFGIDRQQLQDADNQEKYVVFLHGTTWPSKQWPEEYWIQLANLAEQQGLRVKISGGNDMEVARAERIAKACSSVDCMPRLTIEQMATLLANAQAAVAVDTGFGHLAAAMNLPTASIYGSTNAEYTGALGQSSVHLAANFSCSPCLNRTCTYRGASEVKPACYETVTPGRVWQALLKQSPLIV